MADRRALNIDVSIADDTWTAALGDADKICRIAAQAAFEAVAMADLDNAEVSILLTDDAQVQALNRDYRKKDRPTNVLSFANLDEAGACEPGHVMLGDIVIALGVVLSEAKNEGKTLADHLTHLVIHGMLHLLGHDHENDGEAEEMESLEIKTLAGLGVADPYKAADPSGAP